MGWGRTWQSRREACGSTVTPAHRMLPWMWAPSPTLTPSITTELITCAPRAHPVDTSSILAAGMWNSIRWVPQTPMSPMGAFPMAQLGTEGPVLPPLPYRSITLFYIPGGRVLLDFNITAGSAAGNLMLGRQHADGWVTAEGMERCAEACSTAAQLRALQEPQDWLAVSTEPQC